MSRPRAGVPEIALRARLGIDQVRRIFDVIAAFLDESTDVEVREFGVFVTANAPTGEVVIAGQKHMRKGGRTVRFRPSDVLKASLTHE